MFNTLYAKVCKQLRQRTGLTQEELGDEIGVCRSTVHKVEKARTRLSPDQEHKLFELALSTKEEFGEMLCKILSEMLGKRVEIDDDQDGYRPTTALAMAGTLLREHGASLPADKRRRLNRRITTTKLLSVTYEENNADLVELTEDYREALATLAKEKDDDSRPTSMRT